MRTIYAKPGSPITIGRRGEKNALRVGFRLHYFEDEYGPGVAELVVIRPGERVEYPAPLELEGSAVFWTVGEAFTELAGDNGKAELRWYVGDTVAKSETWRIIVLNGLGDPTEDTPEPQQGWVDQVLQAGVEAKQAAEEAKQAAEEAKDAAASGGGGGGTGNVSSPDIDTILVMDQETYNSLAEHPSTTIYAIRG